MPEHQSKVIEKLLNDIDNDIESNQDDLEANKNENNNNEDRKDPNNHANEPSSQTSKPSKKLRVTLYNTRSIFDDIRREWFNELLDEIDSDIVAVTESWLLKSVHPGAVNFTNFEVAARSDRVAKRPGGGVCILARRGLSYHNIHEKSINWSCQLCSIQVGDTYIIAVYRQPKTTKRQDRELTEYILSKFGGKRIVLIGDMNLSDLDLEKGREELNISGDITEETLNVEPSAIELWTELAHGLDLQQQVRDPTQEHGNILDFVLCRNSDAIVLDTPIVDREMFAYMSDHYPVTFTMHVDSTYVKQKRVIWDYRNMNFVRFREILESVNLLERIQNEPNANLKWVIFRDAILLARELTCPIKVIHDSSNPRWGNQKIRCMKNKINRIRKKLKKGQNSANLREKRKIELKECNLNLKQLVREARIENDTKLLDKIDLDKKALYDHVKRTKRGGQSSPPINDTEGKALCNDKAKAEAFQDKFVNTFNEFRYEKCHWDVNAKIKKLNTSPGNLKKKMGKMRRNSAPGIDTIGPILYKESPFVVFQALSHIYEFCLEMDEIPFDWTIVKVTPLWKGNGSKSDISKYRPISLGITAWKLFESLYLDEINEASEAINAYGESQHGFRAKRSTITNLTAYWDFITKAVDRDQRLHVLNLDMSAAFDTVNIDAILRNLSRIGLGGKPGCLMEAWLKNRFQFVEVNGNRSRLCKVNSGVQQGSLTGPALFNLATSELTSMLEAANITCYKYADDIKCIFTCDNDLRFQQVQDAIGAMVSAASEIGLNFNASKSTLMSFGRRRDPFEFDLSINGNLVPKVKETRDLGVIFQSSMNFGATLTQNLKKAMTIIYIVRSTIKVRSFDLLNKIYNCYFLPILTYGSEIFTSDKKTTKLLMYKGFRAFWRLGGGKMNLGDDLIDPFQACVLKELMFFRRIQNGNTCLEFGNLFSFNDNIGTRSFEKQDLKIVRSKKAPRHNFFTNVCTRWFNEMNADIRNSTSIAKFKEEVHRFIKDKFPTPPFDLTPRLIPIKTI